MKNILLIGLGLFGKHIAREFSKLDVEIMAVDIDENAVNECMPYVTNGQIGDTTNIDFLQSLGISNFDVCIVGISDFQCSLETTSNLKDLNAEKIVSRASSDVHAKFLLKNGADEIIYPEKQLAKWTAITYSSDHIFDYIELDSEHSIIEVSIPERWVGKTVSEIDIRKKYSINIIAVKENGKVNAVINPDSPFKEGQNLLVVGEVDDIVRCFKL